MNYSVWIWIVFSLYAQTVKSWWHELCSKDNYAVRPKKVGGVHVFIYVIVQSTLLWHNAELHVKWHVRNPSWTKYSIHVWKQIWENKRKCAVGQPIKARTMFVAFPHDSLRSLSAAHRDEGHEPLQPLMPGSLRLRYTSRHADPVYVIANLRTAFRRPASDSQMGQ